MFERLSKDDALDRVMSLVKKFDEHYTEFKSDNYKELQVRSDFIDELFIALGWDIKDLDEKGQPYRDVILEYGIQGKARHYSSDYCFRINGKPVFLVEAKKPSANFTQNKDFAFQIKNYSWNKKLFFSVITDFENLAIYQTKTKPSQNDDVSKGRVKLINYKDYEKEFDLIYDMLSYEKVSSTEYEKIVMDFTHRKGIVEIDQDLLKTVESWRIILAKNISLRNPDFAYIKDINIAVQRIIDRLIFFRIAEDRDIEEHETLLQFALSSNIYGELKKLFKQCNEKYNSCLFASIEFIDNLNIDDDVLKTIIKQMYKPECQYAWNVLPIDILGKVYEKFLGSEIHFRNVSNGKTVVVEQKELVRKAGGVYYTPQYIVDYIVSKTIGEKLKNATPKTILSFRICDIACGSGSFLIEAYNAMLEWYLQYYTKKEKNNALKKGLIREYAIEGSIEKKYCLTIEEKKRILITHIYGVDIDELAVEVTKLSLYIQLLNDDEMENTLIKESDLHILPDLSSNIQCGNSLIDEDFYTKYPDVTQDIISEVKPFSFEKKFCKVFEEGGFDVIIGNPPYLKEYTARDKFTYLHDNPAYLGKCDICYLFSYQALKYLKDDAVFSFIAPNNWNTNEGAKNFRNILLDSAKIIEYRDFGNYKVFEDADIQTMIYIVTKTKNNKTYKLSYSRLENNKAKIKDVKDFLNQSDNTSYTSFYTGINRDKLYDNFILFNDEEVSNILDKMKKIQGYLNECEAINGIHTHHDFVNNIINKQFSDLPLGKGIFVLSDKELKELNLEDNETKLIKPYYTSNEIESYYTNPKNNSWLIYTDSKFKNNKLMNNYPKIKRHLDSVKKAITSDNKPYGLHRARIEHFFIGEKIISQRKCSEKPIFSYNDFDCYIPAMYYVIQTSRWDMKYLTGLLNSKSVAFWLKNKGKMQGDNYQVDKEPLLSIPIPTATHKQQSYIIERVENIIKFKSMLTECSLTDKALYETKVSDLENDIDQTVYKLYGLNAKDIASVEKSLAG